MEGSFYSLDANLVCSGRYCSPRPKLQVPKSSHIRPRNNSSLSQERISNETVGCARLRGPAPGMCSLACVQCSIDGVIQCALPVFEGLLPAQHNNIILDLLFDLATWQAFAKLRLHTEKTLEFFNAVTTYLGKSICKFQTTTCEYFFTTELPQEHAARGRRTAALAAKQKRPVKAGASRPKEKKLNLTTYKFHALGDYPDTIRRYGTTDNYSTQSVRAISILTILAKCCIG